MAVIAGCVGDLHLHSCSPWGVTFFGSQKNSGVAVRSDLPFQFQDEVLERFLIVVNPVVVACRGIVSENATGLNRPAGLGAVNGPAVEGLAIEEGAETGLVCCDVGGLIISEAVEGGE